MSETQLHEVIPDAKTDELEGLLDGIASLEIGSETISSPDKRRVALHQSLCYVGAFVGVGLCVGVLGPSLPYITEQLPKDTNLAPAFAFRGLGGLFGSFGGAWALYLGVRAHFILGGGVIIAAAGVAFLLVRTRPCWPAVELRNNEFVFSYFECTGQTGNDERRWCFHRSYVTGLWVRP